MEVSIIQYDTDLHVSKARIDVIVFMEGASGHTTTCPRRGVESIHIHSPMVANTDITVAVTVNYK